MEELDRPGDEEGFVAAQQGFSKMRMWGVSENDPVFECLTDFDLPLALHSLGITGQFDHQRRDADLPELHVVDVGHNMIAYVRNMIMTGVFDKFPALNVVIQEPRGTHWIPYLAYRTDEYYQIDSEEVKLVEIWTPAFGNISTRCQASTSTTTSRHCAADSTASASRPRRCHVDT